MTARKARISLSLLVLIGALAPMLYWRAYNAALIQGVWVDIPPADWVDGRVLTFKATAGGKFQLLAGSGGGGAVTLNGDVTGPSGSNVVSDVSILTTRGDLLVRGAAAPASRFAIGTSGKVLASDGTDPAWTAFGGDISGAPGSISVNDISVITTKGDVLIGNNAGNAARLAVGANGKVLKANSAVSGGLEWADDSTGTGTNLVLKGQVQGYDGAANQPVGPGTDGQVLTAASGDSNGAAFLSMNGLVTGPVTNTTIAAGALALSKLATEADSTVLGNASGGAASPTALSVTAPITATAGAITTTMATAKVIGRTTAGTGTMESLAVSGGLSLATAGTLTTSTGTTTIIGRTTAGTGAYESLAVSGGLDLGTAGTLTTSTATAKLIGRTTAATGPYEQLAVSGGLSLGTAGTLTTSTGTTTIIGRTTAGTGAYESLAVSGGLDLGTAGTLTTSTATAKLIGRTTAGTGAYEQLAVSGGLSLATAGTFTTNLNTGKIWGRTTAASGAIEEITPNSTNFSFAAGTLALATSGVALSNLANIANLRLLGNSSGGSAAPSEQTVTSPLVLSAGALTTTMATANIIGRTTAGTGAMESLAVSGGLSLGTAGTLTTSTGTTTIIGRTTAGTGAYESLAVSGGLSLGTAGTLTTSTATAKIIGRTTAATGAYEQLSVSGGLDLGTAGTLTTSTATAKIIGRTTAGTGAYEQLAVGPGLSLGTAGTLTTSIATARLWGRTTAATGAIEEITAGTGLTLSGGTLTAAGGTAATQAEQESASSTTVFVTPGRQQFHPSAVKCRGQFSGSAATLVEGYNEDNGTDNGTGDITFNHTQDFSNAGYAIVVSVTSANLTIGENSLAAGTSQWLCKTATTGTATDPSTYFLIAVGDQP